MISNFQILQIIMLTVGVGLVGWCILTAEIALRRSREEYEGLLLSKHLKKAKRFTLRVE